MHSSPVGERRTGNDDRAEKLRPDGGEHHHCPTGLAVADHGRLTFCLRVKFDDALEEARLGAHDVFDCLARHGLWQEPYEVARMTFVARDPNCPRVLDAADTRPMSGSWINDDERSLLRIDFDIARRRNVHETIIHRSRQLATVGDELALELENMRRRLGSIFEVIVAA